MSKIDTNIAQTGYFSTTSPFDEVYYRETTLNQLPICHYHTGMEIIQTWTEGGHILVGEKIYPTSKCGHLYIINSQELHRILPDPQQSYVRNKLTFSPVYMQRVLEAMDMTLLLSPFLCNDAGFSHYLAIDESTAQKFDTLFAGMSREFSAGSEDSLPIITAGLIEMLTYIYRLYKENNYNFSHTLSGSFKYVRQTISYINNNLHDNLSIETISEQLHISKYYLCHLFKQITGMTIRQYVVEKRIQKATILLQETVKSISEIAIDTGFSSLSLFSRTFKRSTGKSPMELRKK